ncbi:hypothetical protein BB559_001273 [Furculomyces boomerangus]|uniref:ABC transporter domain-containing protein n=1 Tax=Furculomyces boomerangus TaxID=61424 RepID=A0A2T9Z2M4_9FUNG|nr:hypothetical protein BB559_001273 [Furculomyces boomerangus]
MSHNSQSFSDAVDSEDVINKRKSYQFRALARSKLSYQKRQLRVNICCIAICPFLMVAIGGIVGILLKRIFAKNFASRNFVMCSNENALDVNGLPIPSTDTANLPVIPNDQVPNSISGLTYYGLNHYLLPLNILQATGQRRPITLSDNAPSCVWSYSHNYNFSAPYQLDPKVPLNYRVDSTAKPDPLGGWLGTNFLLQNPIQLLVNQKLPWMIVRDDPVNGGAGPRQQMQSIPFDSSALLGPGALNGTSLQQYLSSSKIQDMISNSTGPGLLGSTDVSFFMEIGSPDTETVSFTPSGFRPVPYYEPVADSSMTAKDVDALLVNYIKNTHKAFESVGSNVFNAFYANISESKSILPIVNYYKTVTPITTGMPWGALVFDTIDPKNRKWSYIMQIGDNNQISSAGALPPIIERMMYQQTVLSNGFLKTSTGNQKAQIVHDLRVLPQVYYARFNLPIGSLIGSSLYPFGVSFLISIFVLILVKEKEERILVMMQMNGLKYSYYYIAHYIHFLILSIWASVFFVISGFVFKLEMFTKTNIGVLILVLFIWCNVQISVSFFLSSLFKRSRSAQVLVYLIILWGVIIDSTISFIFTGNAPIPYFIWPPFAMYRVLATLNSYAIATDVTPINFSDLRPGNQVFTGIIALIIGWAVYLLLAVYLNLVLAGEFGISRPWHFFITDFFKKKVEIPAMLDSYDESELVFEDNDVKKERSRILENRFDKSSPLILRRVRKVYPSGKLAVRDVTFAIEKGAIFGLLGPNGAGKTTIISMMIGLYKMSSGNATLSGFDVTTETSQVYRHVGICPQHDILWDDLSIEDHLYFYARLKGIPPSEEKAVVDDVIERVALSSIKNRLSKLLSGGEKRRLSIAIAFVGNPSVVFLDEPTTGLDPEVRRTVWNIVNMNKVGRTIVLTTHSMEEADVLCSRIGIMAHGTMRCIGTQLHLKKLYGSGFLVSIACRDIHLQRAKEFIFSLLPDNARLVDNFVNAASWEFKPNPGLIAHLYDTLTKYKEEYHIDDWGISQTSLDEVFLRIIGEDDADAIE